jgi:hypothetical protein
MSKKKITAPYAVNTEGKGKALVFQADLTHKSDADFANDLETVAATQPKNLQEFITRLVDIQKNK